MLPVDVLHGQEHVAGPDRYGYLCTLHICRNGEFICNGVLVHPEMVLTAQYCFERLGQDFEKSDIVVRCGTRDEESQNPVRIECLDSMSSDMAL